MCLAITLFGCSGETKAPRSQTSPVVRSSSIAALPGTATSVPPSVRAGPDPEAADVALELTDFRQGSEEQTFTVTNPSGSLSVDLDDWSVVTKSRTSERVRFPAGLVLAPQRSLTVHTKIGTNSATDVYLGLPADSAPHVYTPGDPTTGFIDIVSNEGPRYFRYVLPAEPSNR